MQSLRYLLSLALASGIACATACSAPEASGESNVDDGDTETPARDAGSSTPVAPAEEEDSGPLAPDCSLSATAAECATCCDPSGTANAAIAAFGNCVCGTPGTCASACAATYCSGTTPDPSCKLCLDGATQCNQQAESMCDANCQAAMTCASTNLCASKP